MENLCQFCGFKPGKACLEKIDPIGGSILLPVLQGFWNEKPWTLDLKMH